MQVPVESIPKAASSALTPRSRRLIKLNLCALLLLAGLWIGDHQDGRPDPLHRPIFATRLAEWWDWFRYPVERNGFRRLYHIEQNLTDLAISADAERIWVVASRGKIIASDDFGRTWRNQTSGTDADLASIAMLSYGRCGWAVGDRGTIVKTENGGKTWVTQDSGTAVALYSVTMLEDCRHGWIGGRDTLLFTRDGGTHWQQSRMFGTERSGYLGGGALRGGAAGFIIRQGYGPLRTEDGGTTWSATGDAHSRDFVALARTQAGNIGWGLGAEGEFGRTADGGKTWQSGTVPFHPIAPEIAMADDSVHGIIVDRDGRIYFTADGARTWSGAVNPLNGGLNAVALSWDGRRGVAVGGSGSIIVTEDGGRSWTPRMLGASAIRSIFMARNGKTVWAAGDGPTLLKSEDRGLTWLPQLARDEPWLHGTRTLRSLHMAPDGTRGWMAGEHDLFRTFDGGASWTSLPVDEPQGVSGAKAFDDGEVWLTGTPFGRVRVTSDGGGSWRGSGKLVEFTFDALALSADRTRIWAVGRGPVMARSTDRGQSWQTIPTPNGEHWLRDVAMSADGMHGCAVGYWGVLVTTDDGGSTWTLRDSGTEVALNAVTLSDDGHGWAVGNYATLLATADFGETWQERPSPLHVSLTAIALSPDGIGFVGGFARGIARTEDGGATWMASYSFGRAPWVYAWMLGCVLASLAIVLWPAR